MNKAETFYLGRKLMDKHCLFDWKLEFDNALSRFGYCSFKKGKISLSRKLIKLNTEKEIKDVILHEIAHALVGSGNGHNRIWRRKALEIGCDGNRCYDDKIVTPPKKFIGTCPECNRVILRNKRNRISCGVCSRGSWNPQYLFHWKLNN